MCWRFRPLWLLLVLDHPEFVLANPPKKEEPKKNRRQHYKRVVDTSSTLLPLDVFFHCERCCWPSWLWSSLWALPTCWMWSWSWLCWDLKRSPGSDGAATTRIPWIKRFQHWISNIHRFETSVLCENLLLTRWCLPVFIKGWKDDIDNFSCFHLSPSTQTAAAFAAAASTATTTTTTTTDHDDDHDHDHDDDHDDDDDDDSDEWWVMSDECNIFEFTGCIAFPPILKATQDVCMKFTPTVLMVWPFCKGFLTYGIHRTVFLFRLKKFPPPPARRQQPEPSKLPNHWGERRNAWGCWRLSAFVPELSSSFSACAGGIRPVEGMVEGWPDGKKIQDLEVDRQQKVPGDVQDKDTSDFGRKDDERETKKDPTIVYCYIHILHMFTVTFRS